MPVGLRFVKGWPPRLPTWEEADVIARSRTRILAHHGLGDRFPDAGAVLSRFAELLSAKAL
jgi:hypothetical protein